MKFGLFMALCLVLAACATSPSSSGVYIGDTDLKALKPGITTLDDVEARFGSPAQSLKNSDGTMEIQYIYTKQQGSQSEEFLKRLNPFAISNPPMAQITTYRFMFRNGKLVNYKVAQTGGTAVNGQTAH
ncbi:MAG TPA: hypothetical protein VGH91_05810 [Gammaproteobacteria bacterium]